MRLTLFLAAVLLGQDRTPDPAKDAGSERTVRFEMEDGSVLQGEILLERFTVKTRFGDLAVPVEEVLGLRPGFGSKLQLREKIRKLVEALGDSAVETREAAEKKLIGMGARIREELRRHQKSADAEQRARLTKILTTFEDQETAAVDEDGGAVPAVGADDELLTAPFAMRGDVLPKRFDVKTLFGQATLELEHLRELSRPVQRAQTEKKLTLSCANFAALEAKDSGVVVEKGDRIVIRAEGTITMSPWGGNVFSTPDGSAQCGGSDQGPQVFTGSLVMRIGKSGKWTKVGSRATLRASQPGSLQFGIAMNLQYVQGHAYPGDYTVKVKVGN